MAQVGETRCDRSVILDMAHRLGLTKAFPWKDYRDYLNWMLEPAGMDFEEFCRMGIIALDQQYFKYKKDGFATPSKKFEIYSQSLEEIGVSPLPVYREPAISPVSTPDLFERYPLILTCSGRIKEFFHSEGRQIPKLRKRHPDPVVEINPTTAAKYGIKEGEWIYIETPEGKITLKAKKSEHELLETG